VRWPAIRTFCVMWFRRLGRARRELMWPPRDLGIEFPRSEERHCKSPQIPLGTPILPRFLSVADSLFQSFHSVEFVS
jgi:hypothetical protein